MTKKESVAATAEQIVAEYQMQLSAMISNAAECDGGCR